MILITGSGGLLGSACYNYFSNKVKVSSISLNPAKQKNFFQCDLTKEKEAKKAFAEINPDIVIHCAAIKDINFCEKERKKCYDANVAATSLLASLAKENNSFFIYISTDYVFSGERGMYTEDDKPNPMLYYGVAKAQSEETVKKAKGTICRSSGFYSWNSRRPTFVEFVVSELRQHKRLELFDDSFNSPTYLGNMCQMLEKVIELKKKAIFHTAGSERINRYNFGLKIANAFKLDTSLIVAGKMPEEHKLRPKDVSLSIIKTQKVLKIPFLSIDEGLSQLKKDFKINI